MAYCYLRIKFDKLNTNSFFVRKIKNNKISVFTWVVLLLIFTELEQSISYLDRFKEKQQEVEHLDRTSKDYKEIKLDKVIIFVVTLLLACSVILNIFLIKKNRTLMKRKLNILIIYMIYVDTFFNANSFNFSGLSAQTTVKIFLWRWTIHFSRILKSNNSNL